MDLDGGPISGIFFAILEFFVRAFAGILGIFEGATGLIGLVDSAILFVALIISVPLTVVGGFFEFLGL